MEITQQHVTEFLDQIDDTRLEDILKLIEIGKRITHKEPKMWGSIIGFGSLHYVYPTKHEGDMPIFGIANRKQAITLYMSYHLEKYQELNDLGKFKIGKSCLYIKKLSDVKLDVLENLIQKAITDTMNLSFVKENKS